MWERCVRVCVGRVGEGETGGERGGRCAVREVRCVCEEVCV